MGTYVPNDFVLYSGPRGGTKWKTPEKRIPLPFVARDVMTSQLFEILHCLRWRKSSAGAGWQTRWDWARYACLTLAFANDPRAID